MLQGLVERKLAFLHKLHYQHRKYGFAKRGPVDFGVHLQGLLRGRAFDAKGMLVHRFAVAKHGYCQAVYLRTVGNLLNALSQRLWL
jgi:hypothetical protein